MVNSKKMNKSTVAVIVLALLLVLSLVLTATGAWFTDDATGTEVNKNFGAVEIAVDADAFGGVTRVSNEQGPVEGDVMPGDTISYDLTIKLAEGSEAAWAIVVLTLEVGGNSFSTSLESLTADKVVSVADTTGTEVAGSLELKGAEYGNTFQNGEITLNYTVYAIQKANVADAAAALALFQSLDLATGLPKA